MAASGLAFEVADAIAMEMAIELKSPRVHLLQLNTLFSGAFDKNTTCSSADIAKCLERLNGVLPSAGIENYLKTTNNVAHNKLNGFNFGRNNFSRRLGRSPSTDSIAASNFSSDQGSVDSCHYSSNGSDSNSGSSLCSPEEPDRFSRAGTPQPMPPIPPSLQEDSHIEDDEEEDCPLQQQQHTSTKQCIYDDTRTDIASCDNNEERIPHVQEEQMDSSEEIVESSKPEDIKQNYLFLQNNKMVPNSNSISFQIADSQNSVVSLFDRTQQSSSFFSNKAGSCSSSSESSSSHSSSKQFTFDKLTKVQRNSVSSISTHESKCSSAVELQRCNWKQCQSSLEGNTELVEHIRSQHVQVQKDEESFVCLWEGCKVYNRASCSLSWLERHILSHGGNKPFRCIVDSCRKGFPTQAALQKHVNSHFESSQGGKTNKCRDDACHKSFRRKRHLKYKRISTPVSC